MPALLLHAIDFDEARDLFGSGEERRCARILKSVPKDAADARALRRAVTALICGAEGQVLSDVGPFGAEAGRRLDPASTEALRLVLSHLARGRPASIAALDPAPLAREPGRDFWRRLQRRPLFGVDSGDEARWGGLSRDETAAFAAALPASPEAGARYVLLRETVMQASRDGLGLWSLGSV